MARTGNAGSDDDGDSEGDGDGRLEKLWRENDEALRRNVTSPPGNYLRRHVEYADMQKLIEPV